MRQIAKAPEHEPVFTQKTVDVRKYGLILVEPVELDLDVEEDAGGEHLRGALQNLQFRALHVQLQGVDFLDRILAAIFVKRNGRARDAADGAHDA